MMKKSIVSVLILAGLAVMAAGSAGYAKEAEAAGRVVPPRTYVTEGQIICNGVYAQDIDLSGMTALEAENAIRGYVESFAESEITLQAGEEHAVTVTAADLGITWGNPGILDEAVSFGRKGNIVKRYKEIADLARENQVYEITFDFDRQKIEELIAAESEAINIPAQNPTMSRENGAFVISPGIEGMEVDLQASVDAVYEYLTEKWNGEADAIELAVAVTQPAGSEEELAQIKDELATFTTSFSTSDWARSANVRNACDKVNGTVLFPGEEFSTLATIAPFTVENGYYPAGSYAAGKVVESVGGGICQVSSTLYNAVLQAELEVTDRSNHAMAVSYVKVGMDATVSEDSGIDFKFRNDTDYPIYIEGYTTTDKTITLTIYGVETREESHSVTYYSDVTSSTPPGPEAIYADASQPVGFIEIQPAHTGYVADVYKIVTENGVEVSREQITHSVYKMTSRYATVGVATSDPTTYSVIQAAIATGSVDYVKSVVTQLATGTYTGPIPETQPETAPETVPDAVVDPSVETGASGIEAPPGVEIQPPAAEEAGPGM